MVDDDAPPLGSSLAAAGLWTDLSIRLLDATTLRELHNEPLGGAIIPRSLVIAPFAEKLHLLCALGDGQLITYSLDETVRRLSDVNVHHPADLHLLHASARLKRCVTAPLTDRLAAVTYCPPHRLTASALLTARLTAVTAVTAVATWMNLDSGRQGCADGSHVGTGPPWDLRYG